MYSALSIALWSLLTSELSFLPRVYLPSSQETLGFRGAGPVGLLALLLLCVWVHAVGTWDKEPELWSRAILASRLTSALD